MLDWQKHTKLRIFIRTICIVLIVTFFSYDLTWAGAGEVFSNKNKRASQDSPSVEIPQELGVIKESYTSKYNPHKLVIHIQDAHANVEAQENEAKLIKYLKDKYNVNLVSVEGGFGDFDAEFFRSFPKDKKVRDKIARYFLSKAFISGSDYLLITEKNPPAVYGAEDRELYTAHLNTFKDNQTSADSLNRSLKTLESVVSTLKDRYYSKDLKELDAKISDFKQGRISLGEYLSYLNIAAIINNADLSKFPNLYNLITSQELEHKINFEQAESERQDLIDSLTKALNKSDLEDLVKVSLDFKANKITPAEYYTYLEKLTKETSIQVNSYNNLFTYIKYITLSQNLDNSKVFDEIDNFTQSLKDRLMVTGVQKDIDNLTYIIRIFEGLADINLSPKEYEHFKNTREEFNQRRLAQLFRRYVDSSYLKSLPNDAEIDSLEKFYSLAHDRDKAIVSNSLNRLNREYSTNAVIIVAGGFHTQGLTSILKEKDISYVVVAPSIKSGQEKENTYFALLKDKKLPLSDILNDPDTLQIINSISDPEARELLVNYWIARASRYYSVKELQAQLDRLRLSEEDQKAVSRALEEISPINKPVQLEETVPATMSEQEVPVKQAPAIQQGPGLFERFAQLVSSMTGKIKSVVNIKNISTGIVAVALYLYSPLAASSFDKGSENKIVSFEFSAAQKNMIKEEVSYVSRRMVPEISQHKVDEIVSNTVPFRKYTQEEIRSWVKTANRNMLLALSGIPAFFGFACLLEMVIWYFFTGAFDPSVAKVFIQLGTFGPLLFYAVGGRLLNHFSGKSLYHSQTLDYQHGGSVEPEYKKIVVALREHLSDDYLKEIIAHETTHYLRSYGRYINDGEGAYLASAVGFLRLLELQGNPEEFLAANAKDTADKAEELAAALKSGTMPQDTPGIADLMAEYKSGLENYKYGKVIGCVAYGLSVKTNNKENSWKFLRFLAQGIDIAEAFNAVLTGAEIKPKAAGNSGRLLERLASFAASLKPKTKEARFIPQGIAAGKQEQTVIVPAPAAQEKPAAIKAKPEIKASIPRFTIPKVKVNLRPFLTAISVFTLSLYFSTTALGQDNSASSKIFASFSDVFTHGVTIFLAIAGTIGYFAYRIVKKISSKGNTPVQEVAPVVIEPVIVTALGRPQVARPVARIISNPQSIQPNHNLPITMRQELENRIQQLSGSIAQGSKDALARSFRPVGPAELPLPMPVSMLNQDASDRDKVVHILENMQRMMDGTDEKVLRDFERAIDNARDRVTEQALDQYEGLSDEALYRLLTDGYIAELEREFQRIIENQIQHMIRFHTPSTEEQALYVSEEINEKYSRLPRYLKWILTNNPQIENDPLVQEWINTIQRRMSQIPAFPEMMTGYSKVALNKSLYLNPEIARRVLLYLAKKASQDIEVTEGDVRREIQAELARNLPEDVIEGQVVVPEEESISELPPAPQARALPAPNMGEAESKRARLKALSDDYNQFLVKFREQEGTINKVQTDLRELSEGLEEAKRQNDRIVIEALQPAVDGLTSKLRKVKEKLGRLEQEKARYEEQINSLRSELGETGGTTLYALDPLSIGVVAVFTVLFGIPLYITKKILNKWFNTTAGKTLGMTAAIGSLVAGYYAYLVNLTPKIQEIFTNPKEADWPILATLLIAWPVSIVSGILGGKVGKGISHERLYWRANSEFKKGNTDEAISLINQAIKLNSKNAVDYNLLAECQRKKRRFDDAVASYKKSLEITPDNSTTHNNLGVVYVEKGDDVKAIESYKRSLELDANDQIVLANLGRSLHKKGQLLEAARAFQRAQEIKPDSSVTEELNAILQQTGNIPKSQKPQDLEYAKTLGESLRIEKERGWIGQLSYDDNLTAVAWLGAVVAWILGGIFLYYVPYGHHWELGTSDKPATLGYVVWIGEIVVAPLLGAGLSVAGVWVSEKVTSVVKTVYRFLTFPLTYRKLQKVNLLLSDELSDRDISSVAPIYARMSKEYLEKIFRSWMEAGQEEKIARLFKFGNWKSEKTRIYGDIGEYKRVSRVAATKFATTAQEQKVIFDGIDREKEKLSQKGVNNAVGLIKDILPQITENSRNRDEFWHWLTLVVSLPKNILEQGQRQVLAVFTDLREFDRAQEESLNKFGTNQEAAARARAAINGLVQKLERDGLNYPGILKKALAEINKASRNLDEFLFWINEVMHFDKQLWSSGGFLGLLQTLIAYVCAKEEASKKLCHNPQETSQLFQTVDSLREELGRKQVSGDVSMLKDVIPRVAEASRNLAEFFDYITVLKAFDKNVWYGTQSALQAFNNHVAYKQARESAAVKFTQDDAARQKFFTDIDNLRNQLVQKGLPQASDLLKDVLPEVTKTCRSKEEFIYWLGELVGLNISVWRSGTQTVVNNFNDLAGFRQAKEMALEKLCANQQEKDDLGRVIDSLKARLEEKRPSCAGLMKDIVLEILKDIDSLANLPYRKSDFVWWLTMCINFEPQVWGAGTKQVLAGYQELKTYIIKRRELSARFTTNPEEEKRLTAAWDSLDKIANFSKPATISLLNNTLNKISEFVTNPREFVFWIGTMSELNQEALEAFCRDITTTFDYYKSKGKTRDFNHLPAVLNQYYKIYHQTVLITPELLDILTDSQLEVDKRIEKIYQYLATQKIVKLGAPPNLVGLVDSVSFDELFRAVEDEDTIRNIIQYYEPVKRAASKMGRDGVYSYFESQKPAFYRHFLEEAKGLKPGFNQPGEKFRVSYKNHSVAFTKEEESQLTPIPDNVQALRQLIQYLRMEWPNLYDNFIEPKRELIKGRPLEEFVTSDTVSKMAQQLLSKVQGWQFSEQQRNVFIIKIIEVLSFQGTADLRARINNATDDFSRLRLVVQYWERVLKLALEHKWLQENSKYFKEPAKVVKQRLSSINNKLGDGGEGILQFYLSGGTLADFFKGWVSNDCTKNTDGDHAHFPDTQAFVMDPACFLFKVIERNKWVANIYTFAFKDKNGKFYLYIDMFQLNLQHEITKSNQDKEEWRVEFCSRFLKELIGYLGSLGFDYLVVSTNPAQHRIGPDILTAVKRQYGKQSPETISLRKMGGTEFFSEAGVGEEFLWTLNGNLISNDFQDVTGYKIEIDKTTPQVLQLKQSELDHLEKLLGEMSSEETRLASLAKERREELSHLNRKGQEAANTGKNALASQFKNASDQKTTEVQKIEYELNELRIRVREKKDELEHLAVELGLRRGSSPLLGGRLASIIPVTLLSGFLFANKAQAQDFSSGDWFYNPLTPLVFVAGVAGFVGLVCYILYKLFPQKPERDTYYEREYFPRPAFQEYRLPDDLKTQLSQVLDKLSPEARGLLPNSIDVRIPFEVGISRAQAVKALGLLYSNLIKHGSILDFFKDKDFYRSFKQKAKELELADDFDQPKGKSYFFTVPKEKIRYEEDRRAEEFITQYLTKIRKKQVSNTEETLERIHQERSRLLRKEMYRGATQTDLYAYYQLLLSYATLESKAKLDEVDDLLSEKNYLGALSVLEEFFRIDIGGELISLEENVRLKDALNKVLQTELEDIRWQFNRSAAFQTNKQQIIRETNDIQFELRLSERTADDVLRGVASGDCTSINGSAFYNTIPQFMFDPGLLVFKVIQDDKWVGNVYTIVAEKDGNPVLIMDAVQLPVWGRSWPVSVKELSDKVLEKVVEYANSQGFAQVLMSSFVSNFNAIHDHFDQKYPATAQEIEKASGFEHLKALGLWDNYAARNEYLETFSPHWNYSLKRVDPNNPKQTLLLRTIWQRNAPEEPQEIQPSDSGETAVLDRAKEEQKPASAQDNLASSPSQTNPQSVKKNTPKQGHAFRNFCTGILLAAALLLSSGCATAFNSRIGPIAIHSRTEVTLSEPKPHEAPLSISGSVELGEKTKKKEASKTAEVKKYSQGAELLTSGSARLGPLTGDINPKVGVSEVPEGEAPISIGAKASIGEKVKQNKADTEGVELATEAKVRLGPLTAQADPKVGLSDVPEGQKPVDLKGDIKVQEVKEEPVLQQDVQPESQAPDTAQIIAQINEQIKSIQAELEKLRQADSDLKIEVSDLRAKLIDAQKQIEQLKTSPKAPEEVTQLEEKKSDYERQIANLELQQKQAQKELDRILAEKAKAGQEVRQLQNQAPHMQQKVESLHTEINQLETQKKQGAESVTQLQSQKTGLETNVNQLTQDKSKLEQELTGLRQQIGQAKAVLEEAKVKSEPTFKNIWFSLPWQEKLGIILLSLTGIGILVGGVILWKRWSRFKNLSDRVKELQQKADDLERQLSTQRKEKEDLTKEIEQQKTKTLDLEAERNRQADELKRITEQLAALKEEHERIQAELIQVKEAKDKTTEELQAKIAELKSQIAQKESEIVSLSFKEEIAPSVPAPQEISQKLSDAEIDRAVELLRALPSREMQRLLRSQKIDVRERIRFLHDELGLDIANGHGRSLLFRNPDTLRNQKVFLESLGLPLTVTNLASSKRGFAKKELNQIIKQTAWNEEWQVLTNEEKLSVVSHLYDIYGLRVSWLLRDNDWYQLLHAFGLPGEPINYTPRSIDFIQRYELSRFQKFHNTAQTKYRLSKIKEVIKILDLKVINLLDVKTTPEGFEIFVVKPEVREGKVDYQKEHYPLPDTDFIPPESAGEQPEDIAALEPQETILTPQLEEKASHLKEEIASLEKTIAGLEEEKKQKTAQLEKQIQDLTQQKEKLVQEITQLENDLQAKQQAMSLSITQEEDRINKLQEEKLGYEQAVQDLKQKIDAYQQELKALEQQKDKARQELEALQDTSAARAQIETLNKEQQQIEENLRKIKAELVDLTARKKQLEENISAYQGTRDKLQEETAVLNKKIEELNQSIHSLEAEKDALAKQENERAAQIKATQLNQEIEGLTRQKEELSRQNATLENEIKTKQNELALSIREAETQANKIKEEIAGLTQELAVLREEREKLRTETAGLKGYQQDVESKKQELLSLDKEKQALQEEIRSLEAQKTALKEGFDKAQQELEAVKQRLEEQKTSQAQLSQQALTAEQQKLQEQLDTQRQSIQAQMNALEQEFNKQRQEHLATLLKLEEEKNKSKHELDDLLAQKDKAINEMNKLNVALEDLKKTEASYKKAIGYWKFQIELLKEDIVELKEEKEQLAREVETLKKAKEAAPEIEELIEEVRIVSEEVDALLGIIGPQDNTSIYSAVIDKVKATLGNLNYEIKEEPLSGDSRRKNIIVKIPASIGMEHLPKIILNAHMDAYYEHGYTVNSLKGNRRSGGALDDRAGVVAILSALNLIKERFVRQNLAHGPIVLIFTDMEEKGAVGAKDLVSKYNSGSRGATESLFDNTRIAIVLDGPILWMTDVDIRSLNNVEMKNPFVIAKLLNIGKNDKEYRIVNDSVGLVNFRDFSRPRYADKDGEGDHRAFADAYDKKLKRKVPVINIRSPYNDIDENGTIQYHSPNEKVDIENELVPVAQWVAEIVFRLVKDMTPKTRQTSAIITTQKNNELPLPIWEYTVEWDKDYYPVLSPASYQVGPLSSEALKDLTDVLKKLTDVYPVRGEDKIRTIKIVAGNDRLATINREKGEIVLDINVFASKELLLMEVEHELLHLHLPSGQIKQDVKNAVIEEFIILLFEISRFLKFDNEQQLRVLVILKDDPHLDDKEFYRILSKAKSDGLVSVLDDVTRYMKQEGVYPPEFVEYLKDKNGRDIFKDMDRDLHMCKFCLANIFLDRKVIGEIGINIMPIIFNIIYGYAEMNTDIYTNPLFNPDTSKMLVETFGTGLLPYIQEMIRKQPEYIDNYKVDVNVPDTRRQIFMFRYFLAKLLTRMDDGSAKSLLADLVKITPRLLDFDKEFTGEYTNASGLPKAMIFDLDRTLSRTLRVVPTEILEQIKGFLKARVKVAIITAQSLEEVKTYFIEPLYKLLKDSGEPEGLLSNLYVGTSEGSQLWQFFTQGQFKEVILDDATEAPFDTAEHKKELHKIVRDAIREVIRPKGDIPIVGPILIQAPGITFIHNRDYSLSLGIREKISPDQRSELIKAIKRKIPANWQIDILVSGGGTIHIVSKGVDKSTAVGMFRNYLSPDIKPQQILIIGDDFGPGGLDRKMIIPGAKIYSVGAKHNIPPEVEFYGDGGEHGWQRSMHLFVNRIKSDFAGAAKGRGMFSPDEHIDVNEVIMAAQREHRGSLIWGDASGWQDNRAKYAQDIAWVISSLKRYPEIKITGLGKIDIPEVLSTSNIVLIVPHNNSPPGLLVNSENAYQIAHNGLSRNSIYIDEVSYSQLYTFEVAVLLAHEAILLGAKKLAARKGIPWTEQLARDVSQLAEDYEIKIVGRSEKGKGSRFDERIEEILELNKPKPKQARPIEEPPAYEPEEKPQPTIPPQPEPKLQKKPQPTNNNFSLDFPDTKDSVIDGLRKLFFDSMFRDTTNLPVPIGDFPPPMAREIKQSYDLNKVKGLPLDPDFLVALTVFFSRIFPNHANDLINYLRSLNIYIIDNGNSTFGATLSRNTFYIQRSCLEDLLGRPVSVEEIKQGIKNRDKQILVALFRIIVHEIGSAFFKLSHPADQDLERLFLALLSKTTVPLPPGTEQEFRTINSSVNLDSLPRIDWASKKLKPTDLMREEIRLTRDDMTGLVKEINSKLINSLYSPNQQVRNNAAISLVKFGATEALPFLRLFLEKEPDNKIVSDAIAALEVRLNNENAEILKIKTADPFAPALFSVDENNDLVLGNSAIQAINMLCIGYDGMTLEIDVDTLIDTSKGAPQLKGLGFREALASLYQAQEKKQIPENIHVRLINIDPALNRDKIVKVLGLTDDLLKSLVTIPDIPQDYIIKSLEPYLIAGSIRIIFEDNVRYWGKKVDVLVKRGEETKTLSSLGLIVASLAKEPKFYEQLPKELKEYIVAKTDETGKVQLDDEGKIKELIFKPIEKSKVDTQYLDKLDKANKELEGMV